MDRWTQNTRPYQHVDHSERVPVSTSGFQFCLDGVGMENWNGVNGYLLHMLNFLKLSNVADWRHPASQRIIHQTQFQRKGLLSGECQTFGVDGQCINSHSQQFVLNVGYRIARLITDKSICLEPWRFGLFHFHHDWSWFINYDSSEPRKPKTFFHNYSDLWTSCQIFGFSPRSVTALGFLSLVLRYARARALFDDLYSTEAPSSSVFDRSLAWNRVPGDL